MGKEDEMMDKSLRAYEQSTGDAPDTRDFVALREAVHNWAEEEDGGE